MKLHTKITAGAVCLLAGALALAGLLVMAQAFAANLATAVQATRQQHAAAQTALQFTSAPGQGTTVSLALRAAPPNAPAGKEAADAPH